jgi:hypothetical protein
MEILSVNVIHIPQNTTQKSISIVFSVSSIRHDQWRNYYGLRPGEPGVPQPQWAKWGRPGLGDRAKTLARTSDMLQCHFLTIRIL